MGDHIHGLVDVIHGLVVQGYETLYSLSNFTVSLILGEINFSRFQNVKNAFLTINEALNLDFLRISHLKMLKTATKFKIQGC